MKSLITIFVVVVAIAIVGALWLRTVRRGPRAVSTRHPHRFDDSVSPQPPTDLRLDAPSASAGAPLGGGTRAVPAEPGSDFAWEPDVDEASDQESEPPGTHRAE